MAGQSTALRAEAPGPGSATSRPGIRGAVAASGFSRTSRRALQQLVGCRLDSNDCEVALERIRKSYGVDASAAAEVSLDRGRPRKWARSSTCGDGPPP